MRRALLTICSLCVLVSGLTVGASAADYSFDTKPETGYYKATNYEDKYNAAYHYKGQNQIDTDIPEIRYGLSSSMGGFLEGSVSGANGNSDSFGLTGTTSSSYPNLDYGTGTRTTNDPIYVPFATDVTMSQLKKSDGSYGTVAISRAGLSAKVYEGATTESMAKGAGHYVDTAAWNGNIGLFGHNRGSNAYFAALKNVKLSDTVTYATLKGTRTYKVTFVGNISYTDFSYLNANGDNRMTLITCIANQPTLRLCVPAVEVK